MITGCLVRNTRWMAASTSRPSSANSGPRWSMVGMSMARSTRSGTLVGPGICRKCLPVCTVMGVLPGIALIVPWLREPLEYHYLAGLSPARRGPSMHKKQGFALPSRTPAGKTLCGMHENKPMAATGRPKNHGIRRKTAPSPRGWPARLPATFSSTPSTAAATRPTPRSTRSFPWASWCPGPWTRRCGRWRLLATTAGSSPRAAAAPRNAARPSTRESSSTSPST